MQIAIMHFKLFLFSIGFLIAAVFAGAGFYYIFPDEVTTAMLIACPICIGFMLTDSPGIKFPEIMKIITIIAASNGITYVIFGWLLHYGFRNSRKILFATFFCMVSIWEIQYHYTQ